jgi:BlaI family transcriptional regulator, penicillinase repressor
VVFVPEALSMARKSLDDLGVLQKAIMETVWELGEATVQQVLARISRDKALAYTTILSAMQKLEKQGWLRHREEGRAYIYLPTRSREEEGKSSLRKFMATVFGGDPVVLFQHLLDDEELSTKDLTALKKMIEKRRKERDDD